MMRRFVPLFAAGLLLAGLNSVTPSVHADANVNAGGSFGDPGGASAQGDDLIEVSRSVEDAYLDATFKSYAYSDGFNIMGNVDLGPKLHVETEAEGNGETIYGLGTASAFWSDFLTIPQLTIDSLRAEPFLYEGLHVDLRFEGKFSIQDKGSVFISSSLGDDILVTDQFENDSGGEHPVSHVLRVDLLTNLAAFEQGMRLEVTIAAGAGDGTDSSGKGSAELRFEGVGLRLTDADGNIDPRGNFIKVFSAISSGYHNNKYPLNPVPPSNIPGDYNNDGESNAADYTVWRNNLGTVSLRNEDEENVASFGVVDLHDYSHWKSHYGAQGSGSGQAANTPANAHANVPEPTTISLTIVLLTLLAGHRKRSR